MIAINQLEHLSDQDLRDVVAGKLPSGRFEVLMEHLDQCPSCQQRASQSSPDDSFAEALAAGNRVGDDAVLAEADCHAVLFHAAGAGVGPGAMRLDAVLPPIEMLGAYRLLRPIGRGGMGAVYLAQHERLKKRCAIKLLPRQHGFDAGWVQRFEREMQAVASLSHSGIVAATDAGDIGGWHYLVMEYLDGLDLSAIGRRIGPLDAPVAAAIMRDVCDALESVHQAGLVHRDIKPSNIMLTRDGATKLLDLGLVLDQKQSLTDMRLTTVGHVIGTLAFAAPEQLSDGNAVDARADLYSIGATLFQLIAGQPAHRWDRGVAPLVIDKTSKPARRLSELIPDVPESIDDLVASLLQRDPAQRPDSAAEVAASLEEVAIKNWSRSAQAKSFISRAMRIADSPSPLDSSLALPASAEIPQPPKRTWLKWLAAGGLPVAAVATIATIVIIIQQGKSQVRIETTDPAIAIRVDEIGENPSVAQSDSAIGTTEKVFKGKTLGYWTNMLLVERDAATLSEAMTAVASLVEKNDVDAANALLVAGSRYITHSGDLDLHPDSDPFYTAFYKALPDPGIDAIANQLAIGNEKSWLICFYLIQKYAFSHYADKSALVTWASSAENRASAERLHYEIRKLLQAGSLDNSHYKDTARQTSLLLALTLDRPLQQEPKLRETIEEAIAKSKTEKSATELLKTAASENRARHQPGEGGFDMGGYGGGMMGMMGMEGSGYGMSGDMMGSSMPAKSKTKLTPAETLAAHKLGIALPPSLLTNSILTDEILFRDQLQIILLDQLKAGPELYADEITLKLWEAPSPVTLMIPVGQQMTETSEKFWTEVLPLVQTHTSQPRLLFDALEGLYPQQPAGMLGMGGGDGGAGGEGMMGAGDMYGGGMPGMAGSMGAGSPIPKPLADVIIQTKASAANRVP